MCITLVTVLLEASTAIRLHLVISDEVGFKYRISNFRYMRYIINAVIVWIDIGYNGCRWYFGETSGAFREREEGERREAEGTRKEGNISMIFCSVC